MPDRRVPGPDESPIFTTTKSRIRLIMPRGPAARRRLSDLVRAEGGRLLRVQEWLHTRDVSVVELLVQVKKGAACFRLMASLEESTEMMVVDMHAVGSDFVSR